MHAAMISTSSAGVAALIAAWIAGIDGTLFGFPSGFFYTNALNLQLIAIAAGVCTIIRRDMEKIAENRS